MQACAFHQKDDLTVQGFVFGEHHVSIRKFPYPYRAMLAICSDLDETPNRDVFWQTMRFLNTTELTPMGRGVGLEVGNTIYFDMPPDQFSYWNTDEAGRAMVRALIKSGHIDCLHSYGDFAISRAHAVQALNELKRHGCRLEVWIDHGVAPSNFGADIMRGSGDVPGSKIYHADITAEFGIEYVWRGRVTSVIGQNALHSTRDLFCSRNPILSGRTILREMCKHSLARFGNSKYAMHGPNDLLRKVRLRSGHEVYEFMRCNPHWGGVSQGDNANGLGDVVREAVLDALVKREGVCILYTHLGKVARADEPLGPEARSALHLLAMYASEGRVLVTTTRRLLGYCHAMQNLRVSTWNEQGALYVDVKYRGQERDLEGLTLYSANPDKTVVIINDREVSFVRNAPDHTRNSSISLSWNNLMFPHL